MRLAAMFLIGASALVLALSWRSSAQEKPERLYRIRVNDKYGFIDKTGKVVVPPAFEEAGEFSEGFACLKKGERFGFIDTTGRFVIEPTFYRADPFSDDLALVLAPGGQNTNGVWGYIGKTGAMVIKLQDFAYPSYEPHSFAEGLAVYYKDGKWGYLDKTGKTVISTQFDWAFAFSEGLAKVRVGEQYGFIDKSGDMVIKPQFPRPYTPDIMGRPHPTDYDLGFHDGLASMEIGATRQWAYIDKTGKVAFAMPHDQYSPFSFSEGLVRIKEAHGNEGFLDTSGNIAIKPVWQTVEAFSEGLAAVEKRNNYQGGCEHNNCWGYVDGVGRVIIEPQFSSAQPFRGGLAWVTTSIPRKNHSDSYRHGYIERTGKFVWSTIAK
jgi:WG containing repeat